MILARVRLANQQDLAAVYRVEDESFSEPYPHDLIAKLLHDYPDTFFVVEYPAGTVVGYCVATTAGKSAHLISVGVLSKYRRRGFGTALIQRLQANLNPRVEQLRLEVKRDNIDAITLYECLGFIREGEIENYYEDGCTAVKMLLSLRGA